MQSNNITVAKSILIFVYTSRSSFVKRDIEILSEDYDVKEFEFSQSSKFLLPFTFLRQLIFLFQNKSAAVAVIQFGGYHSFLPVLLGGMLKIKTTVIAGGVDCVSYPEINYGYMGKPLIGLFAKYSFRNCDLILPKHDSLLYFRDTYNYENPFEQGLRHFIPELKTKFSVIHNGFDESVYYRTREKVPNTFVTAAFGLDDETNFKLKGIDLILKAASELPQCTFKIIGGTSLKNKTSIPSNMILLPPMNQDELIAEYSKSEYYLQLSMSEGFPNAICEAMLCECIPIGSNVNSIPEIIGDTGYILKQRKTGQLIKLIQDVLNDNNTKKGSYCRDRIIQEYNLTKRKVQLLRQVSSLDNNTVH